MITDKWNESEKKVARRVFEKALNHETNEFIKTFRKKAEKVKTIDDVWSMQEYILNAKKEIENKYDYRYSQMAIVFGLLLREGRITEEELKGINTKKIIEIQRIANIKIEE